MKKLLILAFVIFAKSAFAQKDTVGLNVPIVNGAVVYERVFNAPGVSKNLLYSNAGLWLAETHPYVGDTKFQLADPVLSRVAGRVTSSNVDAYKILWQTNYLTHTYNFTLQIDCKDNKYRIRIYNIQDVLGTTYTPVDDLMLALINSKSYTLANNANVLKVPDLHQHFKALNTVISNVIADINKNILIDNSF